MAERTSGETIQVHLLVLRCQVGDERAFSTLYDLFNKKTRAYLQGMLGDDASDVQQDLWLSVYRGIRGIGNPHAFRSWLFRSTRRKAIDFLRSAKREREWLDDISIDELDASTEDDSNYEDIDISSLDAAMAAIPPPQREVLLLRYRDELSYNEIALVLECPIGTVRARLHYAKRRIQKLLK